MVKFLGGVALMALMTLVFALAFDVGRDPAALRTVEYLVDSESALVDRADQREHAEAMAAIEAERAETAAFYATLRSFGVALIVGIALLAAVMVWGALRASAIRQGALPGPGSVRALPGETVEGRWWVVPPEEESRRVRRLTGGD